MRPFLLLFLLFPVLELFVFVQVSSAIGFFPALLLIILGSMLGVLVLRVAGLATALRARESLNRGELPAQTMLEGLMMALAGGLLILPGFISDVLGLVLLLPFTRKLLAGIDSEGMHLRIGQSLHWLPFETPCNTPTQVREALVSLAHAEVWPKKTTVDA